MPVTQAEITKSKPSEKQYSLADGHGLSLVIRPSGSRLWRYKYQFDGKQKNDGSGAFSVVTLPEARIRYMDAYMDARKLVASGIDPNAKGHDEQRKDRSKGNTTDELANGWFNHWKVGKDPIHAAHVRTRLDVDILPVIGHLHADGVKPSHIVQIVKNVKAETNIGFLFFRIICRIGKCPSIKITISKTIDTVKSITILSEISARRLE